MQKNNLKVTDLQFKQQVITTVSAVLNLYWDLVSFNEDVRAREQEVRTAQQLLDDNKRQVQIGALAEIEVTRAEAQLYSSQQDLVVSQTNLLQQETVLEERAEPRRHLGRRPGERSHRAARSDRGSAQRQAAPRAGAGERSARQAGGNRSRRGSTSRATR